MRAAFVDGLIQAALKDDRIMLITGDLGYRYLERFREKFPDRFLNIGVAEGNLVSVAAGLSTTGFVPFIYSIATFASMRAFEQIRTDIVMQNLNVKIVGIGAGLAYTKAGPTHHSMEDIALMRMLPGMAIINPINQIQAKLATLELSDYIGPAYLRLERNPDGDFPENNKNFSIGKGYLVKSATCAAKAAILFTGTKTALVFGVAQYLAKMKINSAIYAFPTINPIDENLLKIICYKHKYIITIEEHRITGGFGTAVGEYILENNHKTKIIKIGLKDNFSPVSAGYDALAEINGFTAEKISARILKII